MLLSKEGSGRTYFHGGVIQRKLSKHSKEGRLFQLSSKYKLKIFKISHGLIQFSLNFYVGNLKKNI